MRGASQEELRISAAAPPAKLLLLDLMNLPVTFYTTRFPFQFIRHRRFASQNDGRRD